MKTLITGAGSSHAIDGCFLLGEELINRIITLTTNINPFTNQVSEYLQKKGVSEPRSIIDMFNLELRMFVSLDRDGFKKETKTIDEFLSDIMIYPEYDFPIKNYFVDIGKYAIFFMIMNMENNFLLRYPDGLKRDNWIDRIKVELDKNKDNKIITFNYDRLIEHILGERYECRIIHVYGTVEINNWSFGKIPSTIDELGYDHLGDFRIVNDRVREPKSSGIIGIERIAQSLQRLNFVMGFGYDFYNVRNLGLLNNSNRLVFANLYPTDGKETGFKERRIRTDEIRRMIPDAHFRFEECIGNFA